MDYFKVVQDIVKSKVGDMELKESTELSSLNLNSLDLVEITLEIEDKFHIEFNSSEIANLSTIKDVVELIKRKTN